MTEPSTTNKHFLAQYAAAIGIDWADQKHDIALLAEPADNHDHQAVEHSVIESTPQALMTWITSSSFSASEMLQVFGMGSPNLEAVAVSRCLGSTRSIAAKEGVAS